MTLKLKVHSELVVSIIHLSSLPAHDFWLGLSARKHKADDAAVGLLLRERRHPVIWGQHQRQRYGECKHNPCQFGSRASILSARLCFILRQIAVLPTKLFWEDGTHNRARVFCLLLKSKQIKFNAQADKKSELANVESSRNYGVCVIVSSCSWVLCFERWMQGCWISMTMEHRVLCRVAMCEAATADQFCRFTRFAWFNLFFVTYCHLVSFALLWGQNKLNSTVWR